LLYSVIRINIFQTISLQNYCLSKQFLAEFDYIGREVLRTAEMANAFETTDEKPLPPSAVSSGRATARSLQLGLEERELALNEEYRVGVNRVLNFVLFLTLEPLIL
jgi:hypothetical protein